MALCILDDLIQHGGPDALQIIPQVVRQYFVYISTFALFVFVVIFDIRNAGDEDPAVKQAVGYGLGVSLFIIILYGTV